MPRLISDLTPTQCLAHIETLLAECAEVVDSLIDEHVTALSGWNRDELRVLSNHISEAQSDCARIDL